MSEHTTPKFAEMSNEDLDAFITASIDEGRTLVASYKTSAPTVEQIEGLKTLQASVEEAKAEKQKRKEEDEEAAKAFAAAAEAFAEPEAPAEEEVVEDEAPAEDEGEDEGEAPAEDGEGEGEATTASAAKQRRVDVTTASLRKTVSAGTARPEVKESTGVTLVAASGVREFSAGQQMNGVQDLAKAFINRAESFRAAFNPAKAETLRASGAGMALSDAYDVASLHTPYSEAVTTAAMKNKDGYSAAKIANAERGIRNGVLDETVTAAGWCAPSEQTYDFITDYVVDGLVQIAEAPAPRGGIKYTRGPEIATDTQSSLAFGFDQTEAEAIARKEKECETIVCPDFQELRLDAMGYCVKIPFLTQAAYPELIADALQKAQVLWAHKRNARTLQDMAALSQYVDATNGFGATVTDTLEVISQIAAYYRRKWNLGVNATIEMVLPQIALDIFLADFSRRNNAPIDTVRKTQVNGHFSERNIKVQYVADWQDLSLDLGQAATDTDPRVDGIAPAWPEKIKAMVYPAGTFTRFNQPVANLSAVYDAASLSINEYTGIFFEQGYGLGMMGYESTVVDIPVCTAGRAGALDLTCVGGPGSI